MLQKVLSKETCAKCRFCCSFRRQSLWELPRVPLDFCLKYPVSPDGTPVSYKTDENRGMKYAVTDLTGKYRTEDPEEEVPCPFLDAHTGCTLSEEDKPFECKIWPLRFMELPDGTKKIALTPTCPEINKVSQDAMKELIRGGIETAVTDYAERYPFIIKDYRNGFTILN